MDVIAVATEDGFAGNKPADDRESDVEDGKTERNQRNGNSNDGRGFLGADDSQDTDKETNEQAAGITQKDGGGMEIVAQETKNDAGENYGEETDQEIGSE